MVHPGQISNGGRSIGTAFLTLVRICLYISFHRRGGRLDQTVWRRFALRDKAFAWGLVITGVTVCFLPNPVFFGILHLIGAATLLSIPLLPHPWLAGSLGFLILIAAYSLPTLNLPSPWLLPLGIATLPFSMADYYPLVPWLGVVYLGIYLGSLAYPRGTRQRGARPQPNSPIISGLILLGRNSLRIYLLHQPLLLAATYGLKLIFFP